MFEYRGTKRYYSIDIPKRTAAIPTERGPTPKAPSMALLADDFAEALALAPVVEVDELLLAAPEPEMT